MLAEAQKVPEQVSQWHVAGNWMKKVLENRFFLESGTQQHLTSVN
jgi:hypothetical protein